MRRLVHKNIRHTGYAILEDLRNGGEKILPTFTKNLIDESMQLETPGYTLRGIYGARLFMPLTLKEIQEFKKKHGIIPQNYTEELRTGFYNSRDLYQTHMKFCYK